MGCGHSGTTLLLWVLGAHPNILAIPEEAYTFRDRTYRDLEKFDFRAGFSRERRWVEKTPIHGHYIREILKERPTARILLMVRYGRDVALSLKRRTGDFEAGARRWVSDNQEGEKWWGLPQVKDVRNESMVGDFEATIGDVLDFLGEPSSDDLSRFNIQAARRYGRLSRPADQSGKDYRRWQVSQPLFDGRAQWVGNLSDQERARFEELAGEIPDSLRLCTRQSLATGSTSQFVAHQCWAAIAFRIIR